MSWKSYEAAAERGPMSIFWRVLLLVIAMSVIIGVVGFVGNFFTQGARIVEKTIDADNVIYNYEQFKRDAENVRVFETNYETNKSAYEQLKADLGDDRTKWNREDRAQLNTYQQAMVGNKTERNRLAAEYNAKSKMLNREIFKGDGLPYQFPMIP